MALEDNVRVWLDGDSPTWPAHDDGSRWNGAVRPLVTADTLHDIAAWTAREGECTELVVFQGADAFYWPRGGEQDPPGPLTRIPREAGRFRLEGWVWTVAE